MRLYLHLNNQFESKESPRSHKPKLHPPCRVIAIFKYLQGMTLRIYLLWSEANTFIRSSTVHLFWIFKCSLTNHKLLIKHLEVFTQFVGLPTCLIAWNLNHSQSASSSPFSRWFYSGLQVFRVTYICIFQQPSCSWCWHSRTTTCATGSIHRTAGKYNSLVACLHVWIVFENFTDPLRVKGHVDEHGRAPGDRTPPTVDAHAHYDLALSLLAHQRAAVVSLPEMNQYDKRLQLQILWSDSQKQRFEMVPRKRPGLSCLQRRFWSRWWAECPCGFENTSCCLQWEVPPSSDCPRHLCL